MAFTKAMSENKLDLLEILNKGSQIDRALREAMDFCIDRRIDMLEIIPGLASAPAALTETRSGKQ